MVYNGKQVLERGDKVSLAGMWAAAHGRPGQKPAIWRRLPGTKKAVRAVAEELGVQPDALFKTTTRAADGGTLAHPRVAELYAEYLGPLLGSDTITPVGGEVCGEEDLVHPNGVPKALDAAGLEFVDVGGTQYAMVSQVSKAYGLSSEGQTEKARLLRDMYEAILHPVEYNNGTKSWWVEHRLIPAARVAEFVCSFQTHRVIPEMRPSLVRLKALLGPQVTEERAHRKLLVEEQSCVYVFDRGDVVKIGISADPARRKRKLETSACIDIVQVFQTDPSPFSPQVEQRCHSLLSARRVKGEWFRGPFEKVVPIVKEVYRRAHLGECTG